MTRGKAVLGEDAMRDTDLFRMALGIEPPWVVTKSEFDAAAKRLIAEEVNLRSGHPARTRSPGSQQSLAANESKPKSASAGTVSVGEIPLSGENRSRPIGRRYLPLVSLLKLSPEHAARTR